MMLRKLKPRASHLFCCFHQNEIYISTSDSYLSLTYKQNHNSVAKTCSRKKNRESKLENISMERALESGGGGGEISVLDNSL